MDQTMILSLVYLVGVGSLLIFNELYYRKLGIEGEVSRKFAHVTATLATLPFPFIFPSHWYILVLALLFTAVLYYTKKSNHLDSIHDIERKSVGSYLLPISIYLTFLISGLMDSYLLYILPILILAICDPVAAILGLNIKKWNGNIVLFGKKLDKTWVGSGAFFATAIILSLIAIYIHRGHFDLSALWISLVVGLVGTLAEMFSWRGSDNLSIPLSTLFVLALMI